MPGRCCPACDGTHVDSLYELGDVCVDCGFVVAHKSEFPAPNLLSDDSVEKTSESKNWQSYCRVTNATEQRVALAFEFLEDLSTRLNVSSELRLKAASLYTKAFLAGTTDGRKPECVVAACIHLAAIENRSPIPPGRLAEVAEIELRPFRRSTAAILEDIDHQTRIPSPVDYVEFLCSELDMDKETSAQAAELLEEISEETSLIGKSSVGIAGAAVYLVSEPRVTQKAASDTAGVSTETIRQRVKQIVQLQKDE